MCVCVCVRARVGVNRSAAHHLQRRALQVQRNGAKNAGSGAEGAAVLSVGRRVTRCFSSRHTNATPEPTKAQLWLHVLNAAIPFVAFGFMDNLVMILAGDAIDGMLGVKFGLPTLYAAALGQVISDFTGVTFGGVVENMASAQPTNPDLRAVTPNPQPPLVVVVVVGGGDERRVDVLRRTRTMGCGCGDAHKINKTS